MASASNPKDFHEAYGIIEWDIAIEDEYNSLLKNNIWDLVPLRKDRKLVQCKWVYWTKYATYGTIGKYEAHLVAKAFSQVKSIDYSKIFAPMAEMNSICLVFSIAASRKWTVHQMDVNGAFLHGDLHEAIYME